MGATRIVILGGGPAGYEAALVASQLGAEVTVVERDGSGGACVLYDCVPSKTFIATSEAMSAFRGAGSLGVRACDPSEVAVHAPNRPSALGTRGCAPRRRFTGCARR